MPPQQLHVGYESAVRANFHRSINNIASHVITASISIGADGFNVEHFEADRLAGFDLMFAG
jgi:hypothetical protein